MKVLFVTENKLMHYRMPVFKLVSQAPDIDLTLAHSIGKIQQDEIREIIIPSRRVLGPFTKYENFHNLCSNYDVVLCMAYYNNISILRELFRKKRKFKLILWGIGVRASYKHQFGSESPYEKLRYFFAKQSDALLFYSDYPINKYISKGISAEKLFVANNTVAVEKINMNTKKDIFLFIGSLYKEKGIDVLLQAYQQAYLKNKNILNLVIIGDGEKEYYENIVKEMNLGEKIIFTGGIYDEAVNAQYFSRSLLCLSPKQAGLSVLKSLGYGVPFVTSTNAITGGERLNVIEGQTGFYCNSQDELANIILDSSTNHEKYLKVGLSAYHYYWNFRKPEDMANGIIQAINYVS